MRTRDLKRMILRMFGDTEFYGYDVHKTLASEDIKMEISRLYRVLTEMLREGLLEGRWEKSRLGPRKRVYRLGAKGREELDTILLDAIKTVHSFYGKYLLTLPPEVNAFHKICSLLTDELKGRGNIAYLPATFSVMHERFVQAICNKMLGGKVYLVKPRLVDVELKLDNLLFLDGSHDNIPMKDEFFDLLVVVDLPRKDSLEDALREWHRILRRNGRLAVLTPTILVERIEDPMTIGDFVEKYEHETIEKGEKVDKEFLLGLLKNAFNEVEERQIVHMALFLVSEPHLL
jgi:DNA-binding PadR family transcriptional regulator